MALHIITPWKRSTVEPQNNCSVVGWEIVFQRWWFCCLCLSGRRCQSACFCAWLGVNLKNYVRSFLLLVGDALATSNINTSNSFLPTMGLELFQSHGWPWMACFPQAAGSRQTGNHIEITGFLNTHMVRLRCTYMDFSPQMHQDVPFRWHSQHELSVVQLALG